MRRPGAVAGAGVLFGGLLIIVLFATGAAAASYRDLHRLLETSDYTEAGKTQVARSYGAALKAGQEKGEAADLVETGLDGEFAAPQLARVLSLFAQLALAELPSESFISKIREGVAKGVSPERIIVAAERQALMLKRAANIINGLVLADHDIDDREDLLPVIAEALQDGKSDSEVVKIIIDSVKEEESSGRLRRRLLR